MEVVVVGTHSMLNEPKEVARGEMSVFRSPAWACNGDTNIRRCNKCIALKIIEIVHVY